MVVSFSGGGKRSTQRKILIRLRSCKLIFFYLRIFIVVDPPEIQYMEYVSDSVATAPKENQSSGNTPTQAEKREDKPPIGVMMK